MNDIQEHKGDQSVALKTDDPNSVLAIIANAVRDPAVDVAKMESLLNMQERVMRENARREYINAFAAMQEDLPSITKRNAIEHNGRVIGRYADWDSIYRVITPVLQRHGFVLSFRIGSEDKQTTVEAVLSHVGGHVETSGALRLPADTSGAKNAVQGVGSVVSYGKRYTAVPLLNILTAGEDDDGRGSSALITEDGEDMRDLGESAANLGTERYKKWFMSQSPAVKQELAANGEHERLKKLAADADEALKGF